MRNSQTKAPYSKAFRSTTTMAGWRLYSNVAAKGIQEKACGVSAKRKGLNSRSTVAETSTSKPARSRFLSGSTLHNSSARAAPRASLRLTERSARKRRTGRQAIAASSHRGRMRPANASRTRAAASHSPALAQTSTAETAWDAASNLSEARNFVWLNTGKNG